MTKEKFHIEYDMRNTPVAMLWSYISTAYGLKEWFADNARQTGKEVVLDWNGVEQTEENDKSYFELRISQSELTDGTMLTVTDFAEPDDVEEAKDLWNYQIETLQRILGCV